MNFVDLLFNKWYNITKLIKMKGETYMDKKFVKPREAAEILGVSRHTIYFWVRQGKLRAYQTPGGRMMISVDELKGLYKKKEVERDEKDQY